MRIQQWIVLVGIVFVCSSFLPEQYYHAETEKYVKQYTQHHSLKSYTYTKQVNGSQKVYQEKEAPRFDEDLTFLLEHNALQERQREYFNFTVEESDTRIKIMASVKPDYKHKTPLCSQSLMWDKTTHKPLYIRSHIIRHTWLYHHDIESRATFETQNNQFYIKDIYHCFYSKMRFFSAKETLIRAHLNPNL